MGPGARPPGRRQPLAQRAGSATHGALGCQGRALITCAGQGRAPTTGQVARPCGESGPVPGGWKDHASMQESHPGPRPPRQAALPPCPPGVSCSDPPLQCLGRQCPLFQRGLPIQVCWGPKGLPGLLWLSWLKRGQSQGNPSGECWPPYTPPTDSPREPACESAEGGGGLGGWGSSLAQVGVVYTPNRTRMAVSTTRLQQAQQQGRPPPKRPAKSTRTIACFRSTEQVRSIQGSPMRECPGGAEDGGGGLGCFSLQSRTSVGLHNRPAPRVGWCQVSGTALGSSRPCTHHCYPRDKPLSGASVGLAACLLPGQNPTVSCPSHPTQKAPKGLVISIVCYRQRRTLRPKR